MGAYDILRERNRQITHEEWSAEHDDGHRYGALALVAAELALAHTAGSVSHPDYEPDAWGLMAKHQDTLRRLEIAGALIAAELDRLRRRNYD
jgi:hypothetical protein